MVTELQVQAGTRSLVCFTFWIVYSLRGTGEGTLPTIPPPVPTVPRPLLTVVGVQGQPPFCFSPFSLYLQASFIQPCPLATTVCRMGPPSHTH